MKTSREKTIERYKKEFRFSMSGLNNPYRKSLKRDVYQEHIDIKFFRKRNNLQFYTKGLLTIILLFALSSISNCQEIKKQSHIIGTMPIGIHLITTYENMILKNELFCWTEKQNYKNKYMEIFVGNRDELKKFINDILEFNSTYASDLSIEINKIYIKNKQDSIIFMKDFSFKTVSINYLKEIKIIIN